MFASASFFFVPAERQIKVFFYEEDARANADVIGVFTQLENVSTDYTLDVQGRELKLDLEITDTDPRLPVDTAIPEWTAAITEHIAPYLKHGVITAKATRGEISVESRGDGIWFLARGNESVVLNNHHHIPKADSQYWVGYSSALTKDVTPDFEFVGVESATLTVPDGVTLGRHLIPFIEAMESQLLAEAVKERSANGFFSFLGHLGVENTIARRVDDASATVHYAIAGAGSVTPGKGPGELGRVVIDDIPVLVMYSDHCQVMDKHSSDSDDSEIDVDRNLRSMLRRTVQELSRIPLEDITPETFNVGMMRDVIWRALSGEYKDNGHLDHQLYHTARSVSTPIKVNWWLRVLVNMWFMHTSYPSYNVVNVIVPQITELAIVMEVNDADRDELIKRLTVILEYWRDNKKKQG